MKKIQLHWQILIAIILSVGFGLIFTEYVKYVTWMGDVFLRALRMIIVPLIFSSIVVGVTGIGSGKNLGRMGFKTILYYISTSVIAILTGLFLVNLIRPGIGAHFETANNGGGLDIIEKPIGETLINIIPENIIDALVRGDMLAIIFFAILFGFFATKVSESVRTTVDKSFKAIFEVMMKITMFVIKFTPIGIFGIVSGTVAEHSDNLLEVFGKMGIYMLTVAAALVIHSMITLPLIMKFIGKINPIKHLKGMSVPLLTAFSTSSSNATLPLTMEAVENNSGVSNKTSGFVLPLGATVNMDGTALYECVAVMFIAQAFGFELTLAQQAIVVLTALLASIGTAGVPMAGLVTIIIILQAVDLPLEGIALILAVDRPLDMLRTTVNVWSDSCGAVVIAKSEGEVLKV
ncbi:MAG: dicarboxylate/amino acid:cation symporter [Bacteroidetes bacterium]|nr:dicarboxylate/amino acid:cation symporter [Bacteroidota bacterium]